MATRVTFSLTSFFVLLASNNYSEESGNAAQCQGLELWWTWRAGPGQRWPCDPPCSLLLRVYLGLQVCSELPHEKEAIFQVPMTLPLTLCSSNALLQSVLG